MADDWVTPDSGEGIAWNSVASAYDDGLGTWAYKSVTKSNWSPYLQLYLTNPLLCTKVQAYVTRQSADLDLTEVDVYYAGAWHNIYSGALTVDTWVEYSIGSEQSVTGMRFRYHNNSGTGSKTVYVHEADFYGHYPAAGRSFGFIMG